MKRIPVKQLKHSVNEPDLSGSFWIRNLETVLDGKDLTENLHRHDYFFLLVFKKGSGTHNIDFEEYPVEHHSVFFLRPGQVHQLSIDKSCTGYLLQFSKDFYYPNDLRSKELLRKASNKNYCRIPTEKSDNLYSILEGMLLEFTTKQENYPDIIRATLSVFFIQMIRNRISTGNSSNQNTLYEQERTEELLDLIQSCVFEQKLVSYYADSLNLSVYQLNAITKSTLGKTCSELIDEHILLEAKRHLLATTSQVKEIAYLLGYDDASYFTRFFKKHLGISPEEFRRRFK